MTETLTLKQTNVNKRIGEPMEFHISFVKDEQIFAQDDFDTYRIKQEVYQCIVNVSSFEEAELFAKSNIKTVVELTQCLSSDELNTIGSEDCIEFVITPLEDFIKHLEDNTAVLKEMKESETDNE